MKLFRVIQPVHDIERATRFYAAILGLPGERVSPGRHYFDCGGTILACYDPVADGDDAGSGWRPHENQYLYFATPDPPAVEGLVRAAGGRVDHSTADMPWGERLCYARDPDGNRIAFVQEGTEFVGA